MGLRRSMALETAHAVGDNPLGWTKPMGVGDDPWGWGRSMGLETINGVEDDPRGWRRSMGMGTIYWVGDDPWFWRRSMELKMLFRENGATNWDLLTCWWCFDERTEWCNVQDEQEGPENRTLRNVTCDLDITSDVLAEKERGGDWFQSKEEQCQ